ncbi:biotin-dependent carboxyltransferase family protein [Heliorestis convoluta]|uniref:Biotin-dependent carboxyltransferase family protein n=1 Tax=Heliorestis convoluta TaxID=356322 RepID=A0A5Q2MZV1_9FIRM|nr:biotin-dependent carboxyltransferase family protein [Heliorestis convoluta]QGG48534.1 biotin-dependent carboxyltransferase family protein [Heliorestis convoluta]
MTVEVLESGLYTTIQDKGRYGYQAAGIPVSGAMDSFALQVANRLVGNETNRGALEMTLQGPTLLFEEDCEVAITGADMTPTLNDQPVPLWVNLYIPKGSILRFGYAQKGCHTYLAVAKGWKVPEKFGSTSTYVRGAIGGYHGRVIKRGDILLLNQNQVNQEAEKKMELRALEPNRTPQYNNKIKVAVIAGPQAEYFTDEAWQTFYRQVYRLTTAANRMGYPLEPVEGKLLTRKSNKEMISDATAVGAIQVPPNGQPIVLMADRQTTGGYPKIATVISAHISRIAQAQPGSLIQFAKTDLSRAHQLARQQQKVIEEKIITGAKGKEAWLEQALLQRRKVIAQIEKRKGQEKIIYSITWEKENVGNEKKSKNIFHQKAVIYPEIIDS